MQRTPTAGGAAKDAEPGRMVLEVGDSAYGMGRWSFPPPPPTYTQASSLSLPARRLPCRTPAVLVTLPYHAPPRPSPFSFAAPPSHCTRTLTCLLKTLFAIQFSHVANCWVRQVGGRGPCWRLAGRHGRHGRSLDSLQSSQSCRLPFREYGRCTWSACLPSAHAAKVASPLQVRILNSDNGIFFSWVDRSAIAGGPGVQCRQEAAAGCSRLDGCAVGTGAVW